MDLSPCLSIAFRRGGGTAALCGSGCVQRQHGECGKKHGLHQNPPEVGGWRGGICQAGLTFWASNITRSSPRRIPLGIGRQIPQHDPSDQGMLPAGLGVQRAGHGGLNRALHHGSCQLIQQHLGLLQVRSVEAFGEPTIDWREQITSFRSLALIAPELGEVYGRTQFEQPCLMTS
jgi:hypothetical protein